MDAGQGIEFGATRAEKGGAGQETPKRDVWLAVRRGLRCRCPNCGEATLFTKYLKVADHCAACGEELHHHRADDMPPWLTLVVVCHILGVLILSTEQTWETPSWVHFTVWPAVAVIISLALLPRMKGAVVGMQWALRMHGFQKA
ncbi:DUF983 domain-containing protein [Neomegalonema sp.]|uniref:DUF983 domain-containing protein n=1 Tax=Neomegalonema sp. TaxID=2039713 RepID=UPI00260BAA7B|nr:DUF983 domain-containing protein [Neomegalonema sp.]MDD2869828.1 DUF983 domain-containing protein [Neomegalonema sp.]